MKNPLAGWFAAGGCELAECLQNEGTHTLLKRVIIRAEIYKYNKKYRTKTTCKYKAGIYSIFY